MRKLTRGFDTIKLKIPESGIVDIDLQSKLIESINSDRKGAFYKIDSIGEAGISNSTFNGSDLVVSFSAKILLDQYLDCIKLDNIKQAFDTLNRFHPIKIDANKAIDTAQVLKVDCTTNIKPNYKLKNVRDAMLLMKTNPKYGVKQYNGRSLGIEINGSTKSDKRRMIGYSKQLDLQKKYGNGFLESCNDVGALIESSNGIWRIEQNLTSFKAMREHFQLGAGPVYLLPLLQSKANPNFKQFNEVIKDSKQLDLFGCNKHEKLYRIEKDLGRMAIINEFGRDIELIKVFLSSKLNAKNISRYVREYSELIRLMKKQDAIKANPELTKCDAIIKEITEQLRLAS